jgi:hypothetical protein
VDEYARPRETSPALLVDVTSSTLDNEDARHVLRPEEVRQLADRLMTEYHRAQFLSRSALVDQRRLATFSIP